MAVEVFGCTRNGELPNLMIFLARPCRTASPRDLPDTKFAPNKRRNDVQANQNNGKAVSTYQKCQRPIA